MYINIYTKKIIISYAFLGWLSFALYYVSWLESVLNMWWALVLYSVILFLIYALWKFLHGREQAHFFLFFISFLYRVSVLLAITILIIWTFVVYHNELRPAQFPLYTLSNWERTLKFQTVSHIASSSFYLQIRDSIKQAKDQDFVLLFEGVRPWSEANMEAFNRALWINFSDTLYENFSRLYGVTSQDNMMFLWLWETADINVDLDIDTIMDLYREKKWEAYNPESTGDILQVDDEIIRVLADIQARELAVLQYFNQALLNFFMKQSRLQWFILERTSMDIFSVILWERDQYIAEFISESEYEKMFALYGKLHFEGILRELKLRDMRWEIVDVEYKQVIERASYETEERYRQLQSTNSQRRETILRHIQMSDWH